jgi:hypothetical protein
MVMKTLNNRPFVLNASDSTYHESVRAFNNTFVTKGTGGFGFWISWADTLIFKNNIIDLTGTVTSSLALGYPSLADIQYKDIDYNHYRSTSTVFQQSQYGSNTSWVQWQGLGYDAHSDTGVVSFANIWGTNTTDYMLSSGSAGIDAGTNLSTYFTTDILGTTRPQGAAYDMGAFEYVPPVLPASISATTFTKRIKHSGH